jgi:hypothetical protein
MNAAEQKCGASSAEDTDKPKASNDAAQNFMDKRTAAIGADDPDWREDLAMTERMIQSAGLSNSAARKCKRLGRKPADAPHFSLVLQRVHRADGKEKEDVLTLCEGKVTSVTACTADHPHALTLTRVLLPLMPLVCCACRQVPLILGPWMNLWSGWLIDQKMPGTGSAARVRAEKIAAHSKAARAFFVQSMVSDLVHVDIVHVSRFPQCDSRECVRAVRKLPLFLEVKDFDQQLQGVTAAKIARGEYQVSRSLNKYFCYGCRKPVPKAKWCAGCSKVSYCSVACQKAAWSLHKLSCERNSTTADKLQVVVMVP